MKDKIIYCNCGTQMTYLGNLPSIDDINLENHNWICSNCGIVADFRYMELDADELENLIENHKETLEGTKILQEVEE